MLPAYVSGSLSHSWWAMVVLLLVAASLYLAYVFSYLYLWTVSPAIWPDSSSLPPATWPFAAAALLLASSGLLFIGGRTLSRGSILFAVILLTALAALIGALAFDMIGHWRTGLRPTNNGHAAMVSLGLFLQMQLAVALLVMSGYVLVRHLTGRLDAVRRVNFDNL